jgi:hypothetical protein
MITADRFIETSENYEAWLSARRGGVTATEISRAATPAGLRDVLADRANPQPVEVNAYMQFGSDNEDWLAVWVMRNTPFNLFPNKWLIRSEQYAEHMATPDLIQWYPKPGEPMVIGEIKTGGKAPLDKSGLLVPPIAHRRQMQWQMYCVGPQVKACVYAFMLRAEVDGKFVPAWLEPMCVMVPRDEEMIADLVKVADQLLIDWENWEGK